MSYAEFLARSIPVKIDLPEGYQKRIEEALKLLDRLEKIGSELVKEGVQV